MSQVVEPIKIGTKLVKNRITFAPTVKFDYADETGKATEKHIKHYEKRAAGGAGLICVEATAVLPGGRFGKNHMGLWSDEQIEGHSKIVQACRKYDAVALLQINHTGYVSNPECGEPIGPSQIMMESYRGSYETKELTEDDLHKVQDAFVKAACRAKEAGYDGIQLHGCHGYLVNQFVSPVQNKRRDSYGGSVENRARFGVEIIKGIRQTCGEDFIISVRTTGCEPTIEEAILVAEEYVKAGCDYLQVSSGMTDLKVCTPYPDSKVSDIQSLGVYFHEHFKGRVPVSCVGGIDSPEKVTYLLSKDYVDTVDVARAILADPEFANAVLFGKEYRKCYHCARCQYGPFTEHKCPAHNMK